MSGKYNYLTNSDFVVIILTIMFQFLRVNAFILPRISESKPLLLLSDNKYSVAPPLIPDDCKEAYICDHVGNYPSELAANILARLMLLNITKFANDQLDIGRHDDLGEISELCATNKERIMTPLAAKDYNNEWHFILNMPRYPSFQSFRIHECRKEEKVSCFAAHVASNDFSGLNCEQVYTKRKMVYMHLGKNILTIDDFTVPSCCNCFLEPS
ncbi:uncharacterized protein LOC112043507 [Bicyclus anynana]|uniref:Uncharacterized protein LOC112043507 n=1 Tax=Bicyclus anynana TaxID=110368 RepID=A0A6J1MW80_BICAN|nr:uncharacterized protein LOC112043507 [Bicyclus anynana]